jgi:aminoglycoside 6'-N-acetyltransferase
MSEKGSIVPDERITGPGEGSSGLGEGSIVPGEGSSVFGRRIAGPGEGSSGPGEERPGPGEGRPGQGEGRAGPDAAFTELMSERLILRRFQRSDIAVFAAYRTNPAVARFQGWDAPYSLEQAEQFVRELEAADPDTPGAWFQFAVASRADGALLGDCGTGVRLDDPRQVEIGFTIAPGQQGNGYATEAVRRLLHYWFGDRGKHRVTAVCDTRNTASARVLRRSGFRQEGHLRQSTWAKGEWTDEEIFAVLDSEWPPGAVGR